ARGREGAGRARSDLPGWREGAGAGCSGDSVSADSPRRCGVPAARRKDPVNLYCSLTLHFDLTCVGEVGGFASMTLGLGEAILKYPPGNIEVLPLLHDLERGPCLLGSLTAAVSA